MKDKHPHPVGLPRSLDGILMSCLISDSDKKSAFVCVKKARVAVDTLPEWVFSIDNFRFCTTVKVMRNNYLVAIHLLTHEVFYKQTLEPNLVELRMSQSDAYAAGYNKKKPWLSNLEDDYFDILCGEVRRERSMTPNLNEYLPKHLRTNKAEPCVSSLAQQCAPLVVIPGASLHEKNSDDECPVCLEKMKDTPEVVRLPVCDHLLCAACAAKLLKRLPTTRSRLCAMCRKDQGINGNTCK